MAKKKQPVYHNYITEYWQKISSGEITACEKIKKVYKQLADDCSCTDGEWHFDIKSATRPIIFVESFCRQSKGEMGKPLKLMLWQKALIQAVYGFVNAEGVRKYREVLLVVGRKNGKSALLSALSLYELLGDHEGGPEIDTVASKRDQARLVFDEAVRMVTQSPDLARVIKKRRTDMYCSHNFGVMQPLASDSNTLDGLNPSCVIIDELHSIKDRNLYDVMKQAQYARRQPLMFEITTAGFNRQSIYDSQYDYAANVISGTASDEHFLPLIYELDNPASEWADDHCWIKANPGLGVIKDIGQIRDAVEKAKTDTAFRKTVLAKDFNAIQTEQAAWLTYDQLFNPATFDLDDVRDTYAIGGADLSATTDLTCATLIIRKPNDDTVYVLQQYFLPESRINQIETQNVKEAPYRVWEKRGLLTVCPGTMVDYHAVTEWYKRMQDDYDITLWKLGYDRALAGYWAQEMSDTFGSSVMEKVAQGPFTWSQPMKELGAALADKKINYNKNPMLAWCLSNTGVKTTGSIDTIQPVKIHRTGRIDGMVSLLNAWVIYDKYMSDYTNLIG